jgi:flagellar motor protein MotB
LLDSNFATGNVAVLNASTGRIAIALCMIAASLPLAGCGRYGLAPNQPQTVSLTPPQQQALAQQTQQYQTRANDLDRSNQELEAMLAQSRQQTQLLEDQVRATQTQLRDTADRLAATQVDNDQLRSRTSALAASVQTRSQAEIRANNSLVRNLTVANMPGINVRPDGDVVRIELPSDQLFNYGTAQLKMGADATLRTVAADIIQNYPQQLIGVEVHTDGSPATSAQLPTDQHISVSQAMAVYDMLIRLGGMPPKQLFVVGHGSNHPLVSNATEAGRVRNRRVELVVYPETMQR